MDKAELANGAPRDCGQKKQLWSREVTAVERSMLWCSS